jgi:iron complex transport system substrate-binding protein
MNKRLLVAIVAVGVITAVVLVRVFQVRKWLFHPPSSAAPGETIKKPARSAEVNRIISLAPSITEILFALGLENKIVGVTRYCDHPPEAKNIDRIGGYYDPNYELIVAKEPDLVIMLNEHEADARLSQLGVRYLKVKNLTIEDIKNGILKIGQVCAAEKKAREIVADVDERLDEIRAKTEGLKRPKVLLCVGKNMGSAGLEEIFIAGKGNFYDDLLNLAGGANVYDNAAFVYPQISREGIIRLNPDVIIDLISKEESKSVSRDRVMKQWLILEGVKAVDEHRIYILDADYVVIPGPRITRTLEDMLNAIHPEIERE